MKFFAKINLDYGLLLALLVPLLAVMPLLTHAGLPNTADGPAHLMRQVELNRAWQEGNFYPRWGTDLAFGHGMPIFSYAPPALYQLTQLFHLSGLPLAEAMKAVVGLDFLLYSLGMFLFVRRLWGPYPALVAAALYVYTPYRLREAYIQGNYGQFTGLAFYPFICWAFYGLITTGQVRYLVAAAFSLAGLLFSHNISFMLFAPLLAAYLLFLLILTSFQTKLEPKTEPPPIYHLPLTHHPLSASLRRRFAASVFRPFLSVLAAGLLGLGLAAIFWLPAFGERHEMQLEGITRGFFDFRQNFISLPEFLAPPLPLDLAAINPEFPLSLGLPQILGAAAGLVALLVVGIKIARPRGPASVPASQTTSWSWEAAPTPLSTLPAAGEAFHFQSLPGDHLRFTVYLALFFAGFFGLYVFLALPLSASIWAAVPLLELAEFPWRMLGPAIFCASLLGAFGFTILDLRFTIFRKQSSIHLSNVLFLIFLFLPIVLNAYYLYPSQFIVWGTPAPADAFAYEITSGAIGTTSTGEFLPRYAQQRPRPETLWPDYAAARPPQKIDPASLPSGATVETVYHRSEADAFLITTPELFTATLRTLYWPGWQVYLDGQPAPLTVTPETGLIQTSIPPGPHTLTLQLESTPLRTAGLRLTSLTFGILVVMGGMAIKKYFTFHASPFTPQRLTPRLFVFTVICLITLYLFSRPLAPLLTQQSDPNRPQPAGRILQIDFGQTAAQKPLLRLVGLDELPSAVELTHPEAELTAVLYWRALEDLETNYSVFLHLDAPNGQTFATVDEADPENIPTRNWPPGLYLRNSLHLKIPPDLPPIRYDVTVGLYDRQSAERLVIRPGEATSFKLGSLWLVQPRPRLPQTPLAFFGPHITLWQASYPAGDNGSLVLYWQTTQSLDRDDTIFIHLLDATGNPIAQADGAPYAGLYPLSNWQPGQVIVDARPMTSLLPPSTDLATIAVGVYDPTTGERLPATDAGGQPLANNSFILPVNP